jgi:hypothetical protein
VNGGPTVKRISPAPMGRAFRIRKRSHHLTIVVAQREAKVKPKPAVPKAAAAAPVAKPTAVEKPKKKATTKSTKSEKKSASKKS